jgi:hypothetical protein
VDHRHGAAPFDLQQVNVVVIAKYFRQVGNVFGEARHRDACWAKSINFESVFPVFA